MKNIWNFIKEKSYYFLGGTVILIILLIVISSCSDNSDNNSYEKIEQNMVNAAKKYYEDKKNNLPKEEGQTIKVNIGTLVDAELLSEVTDPSDSSLKCTGYVEVTKLDQDYSYEPFLTCGENYKQEYLTDAIKETKTDEYGNGLYNIDGEYIYKGQYVDNYISFNDLLWRIIKIDTNGDIKLVLSEPLEDAYYFDTAFNNESGESTGITTDYLHTSIRKSLNDYYQAYFDTDV